MTTEKASQIITLIYEKQIKDEFRLEMRDPVYVEIDEAFTMALQSLKGTPKGEWIDTGSGEECSICKEIQYGYDNFRHYCPYCGASMQRNT